MQNNQFFLKVCYNKTFGRALLLEKPKVKVHYKQLGLMLQEHFPINFSHKVGALLFPPGWDVSLLVMGLLPYLHLVQDKMEHSLQYKEMPNSIVF